MNNYVSLIMAGGVGKRLWPLSRIKRPKQFLKLIGDKTLLEYTYDRACRISGEDRCFIVAGQDLSDTIHTTLPNLDDRMIIKEPMGKNTFPCIALSIAYIKEIFGDGASIIAMPADHYITDESVFVRSGRFLLDLASESDYIFTLGIQPTSIQTGYGHIIPDLRAPIDEKNKVYPVIKFVEKPDEKRIKMLENEYEVIFWNSGIFIFNIKTIQSIFEQFMQPTWQKISNTIKSSYSINQRELKAVFKNLSNDEAIPIDYVMEKARNMAVMRADFGWNDVGSFESFLKIYPQLIDKDNNLKSGYAVTINTRNTTIINKGVPAVVYGVDNILIVTTDDVVLVMPRSESQKIKDVLNILQKKGSEGEDWIKKLM
ncbi:MAG: hypothetical protein DRH51_00230 [Candidatus Coatesbacteria bacterium]|nr:MAG: hypothetical protein DRH51_00230 [Candidatus Coatesbacteria bacterium]